VKRLVLLAFAVACGGAQKPRASNGVTVIEQGAEPRQIVKVRPPLHAPEWIEQTVKMRTTGSYTDTTLHTEHTAIDYPSIQARERLEATQIEGSDMTLVSGVVEDVQTLNDVVDRRVKAIVARSVANLRGATVAWRLAPDGRSSVVDSTLATLAPGVLQALVTAPTFPSTPIGIGAKWHDASPLFVGGIHWNQERRYTLTALDDNWATITMDYTATAGSQPLDVEPSSTVRLTSGTMTLSATAKIPLHGLAWEGDGRGSVETNVLIVKPHERTESSVTMEIISAAKPSR
jgi:hypothetical protein